MKKILRLSFYLLTTIIAFSVCSNIHADLIVTNKDGGVPSSGINFDLIHNFTPDDDFGVPSLFKKHMIVMGHGAGDPGAQGSGTNEATFNRTELLPLLQKYASQLKYSKIYFYDPNRDMYQDSVNDKGAYTINNYESVTEFHLDSSRSTTASGGHVIVHPTQVTNTNRDLAQVVNKYVGLNPAYARNGGLSLRSDLLNLNILRYRGISYRLVEMAFISNPNDVSKLRSNLEAFAKEMVERITGERITPDIQASSIDYFAAIDNQMKISGWFESSKATTTGTPYLYIIDREGNELARYPITLTNRPDVANAYPDLPEAGKHGFSLTVNIPDILRGKQIYFKAGKSSDSRGDHLNYEVYFTKGFKLDSVVKTGNIDEYKNTKNNVEIRGWFFDSRLSNQGVPYLFVYDENNQEIKRIALTLTNRVDVQAAYRTWSTSLKSGFNAKFTVEDQYRGHQLHFVAKNLTSDQNNVIFEIPLNGTYQVQDFVQASSLDQATYKDGKLKLRGWHYNERNNQGYRFLVLTDKATHQVVKKVNYQGINRADVTRLHGDTAKNSGFDVTIDLSANEQGKTYLVKSIITEDEQGNNILSEQSFKKSVDVAQTTPLDPDQSNGKTDKLYRVYNKNSGEHLYTASLGESKHLINLGWKDEGVAWNLPESGTPIYRLYNPNSGEHFYTANQAEYENVAKAGWNKEGIVFHSDLNKKTPIYRLFNPNADGAGSHHYTVNQAERDNLVKLGWKNEDIAFYGA